MKNTPSRFAPIFYAGFVLTAFVGLAWAVIEDPDGKDRVSIYAKDAVVGDTPVHVDAAGDLQVDVLTLPAVTGSVTANAGTNLNTSALALESGGNLAAAATALGVLDDWDESDRAKVNVIAGQAGIAAGTGVDGATVPRVTLATNVGLPAGTNNIGDVDVLSSALPTGAATAAKQPALGTAGSASTDVLSVQGIAAMTPLLVDGSGATQPVSGSVTANAGTNLNTSALALEAGNLATMAGAFKLEDGASADQGRGVAVQCVRQDTPADTSGTDGDFEYCRMADGRVWMSATIDAAIPAGTNNIGDVDVLTLPAIPAGNNNIGDFDVASIAAGDNNIGNVDVASLPSVTIGTFPDNEPINVAQINGVTVLMGAGNTGTGSPRTTQATDQAALAAWGHGATGAAVAAGATQICFRSDGGLAAGTAACTAPVVCQNTAPIAATSDNANTEIVALTSSETIYVCGMTLVADAAATVQMIYGTGTACATGETDLTGSIALAANGGFSSFSPFDIMRAAVSNAYCIEITGTGNVGGWITYAKF